MISSTGLLKITVIPVMMCSLSGHTFACSVAACLNHGIELNRSFVVAVRHDRKPLRGVRVRITGRAAIDGLTQNDGKVNFTGLSPGDYWLTAEFLGISAAYECFHVSMHGGRRVKRSIRFEWGDEAPAIRRVSGVLLDPQPGTGGNPLWNSTHKIKVPIAEASLTLQNPLTGDVLRTSSDAMGAFAFDGVAKGTYVLHVERGPGGRAFDPTDLLIRVSPSAPKDAMTIFRTEPSGGSCGGTALELQ
jgi:hypothetical protein